MRCATSAVSAAMRWPSLSRATRAAISSLRRYFSSRSPMQIATSLGSSAPLTGNSQLPCSSLLADAHRLVGGAVKLLAHLHFDQRALLLDHDDEIEPFGEFGKLARGSIGHGQPTL